MSLFTNHFLNDINGKAATLAALAQVFQGVILATRDRFQKGASAASFGGSVTSPEGYLVALWIHECHRVFCDKMITLQDKEWVESTIRDMCK